MADTEPPKARLFQRMALVKDGELRRQLRWQFEERAAICEYDGGMDRVSAEWAGVREVEEMIADL